MSTISTLETEVEEDEATWTPESSPRREKEPESARRSEERSIELERVRTFGTPPKADREVAAPTQDWRLKIPEKGYVPGRNSVGVAF